MKKKIALILALIMLTSSFSAACSSRNDRDGRDRRRRDREEEDEDEDRDDEDRIISTRPTGFDPEPVDVTETFDTFYADPVDTPWVLENNIPFTRSNITSYFNEFVLGSDDNEIPGSVVYYNTCTISRPIVSHYPAEEPGYTVYEINYTINMPMSAFVPSPYYSYSAHWWYHDVEFLDYYTGMTYPSVDLTSDTDSYCISGDVVYNGQTYNVSCYAYRETEVVENSTTDEDGGSVWNYETNTNMTVYFIVPTGYDGIVMYVYTADDSDESLEECRESSEDCYNEPHIFGEPGSEEYIPDYAFISIAELG